MICKIKRHVTYECPKLIATPSNTLSDKPVENAKKQTVTGTTVDEAIRTNDSHRDPKRAKGLIEKKMLIVCALGLSEQESHDVRIIHVRYNGIKSVYVFNTGSKAIGELGVGTV